MVKDQHVAWHAGKSRWGSDKNLNLKSIGIELVNKGDEKFPFLQIKSLCMLIKYLKNKHKIQKKHVLGHSHIAPGRKLIQVFIFLGKSYLIKNYLITIEFINFFDYITIASWLDDSF